jgi:hypothetical protein
LLDLLQFPRFCDSLQLQILWDRQPAESVLVQHFSLNGQIEHRTQHRTLSLNGALSRFLSSPFLKHRDEKGGEHGHSQFPGHSEHYPAAEAEQPLRDTPIPGHAGARQPGRTALVALTTSIAAAAVLRPLFAGLDREQFLVCGLDAKHSIIGVNVVSIGSLALAIVHPREVFSSTDKDLCRSTRQA